MEHYVLKLLNYSYVLWSAVIARQLTQFYTGCGRETGDYKNNSN